jgi:fibronectin-binding autotransporter adhesin
MNSSKPKSKSRRFSKYWISPLLALTGSVPTAIAADGTWNATTSGTYSNTGNWVGGTAAGGNGSKATFQSDFVDQTVSITTAVTLGSMAVDDTALGGTLRLALSGGSLTFNNSGSRALVDIATAGGATALYLPTFSVTGANGLEIKNSGGDFAHTVYFTGAGLNLNGGTLVLTNTNATAMTIRTTAQHPFGTSTSVPDVLINGNVQIATGADGTWLTLGAINGGDATSMLSASSFLGFGYNNNSGVFGGGLSGAGSFTKSGTGLQAINGVSTGNQRLIIAGGGVEAKDGVGLGTNAVLKLQGGVFVTSGTFSRTLGSAVGQVFWANAALDGPASGGFAAKGGKLTVNLNAVTALEWGIGAFNVGALRFGGVSNGNGFGDSEVEFVNNINLGATDRNVQVYDNASSSGDFVTLSGVLSSTGGGLTKQGDGLLRLTGSNTYTGATAVQAGVVNIQHSTALGGVGAGTTVSSGAALEVQNNITIGTEQLTLNGSGISSRGALRNISGTNTWQGEVTLASATRINSDAGSLSLTAANSITATNQNLTLGGEGNGAVDGVIATGNGTFSKDGSGTWALSGVNTYTGATNISAGTLRLTGAGSINATSGITVTGGAQFRSDSSTGLSANVTLTNGTFRYNSAADFTGTFGFTAGTIAGTNWNGSLGGLTIGAGQNLSPGNSTGTALTTSQTWAGGGSYQWEINDVTGEAGSAVGWDLISGTGELLLTASEEFKFTINVTSLTLGNASGAAANFNNLTSYKWLLADFGDTIAFDASVFELNTTGFTNAATGSFGLARGDTVGGDDSQLYMVYQAVPEPGAVFLLGFGLVTSAGVALRRRKRIH